MNPNIRQYGIAKYWKSAVPLFGDTRYDIPDIMHEFNLHLQFIVFEIYTLIYMSFSYFRSIHDIFTFACNHSP